MKHALVFFSLFLSSVAIADVLTIPQTSYKRCKDQKESGSCYELGYLYQNTSKPGDVALGNQYVMYGCKLEMKKACTLDEANRRSAAYLQSKKEWDRAKEKALAEMPSVKIPEELACEKGDGKACNTAGVHYFYTAVIRNPEKGKAMYEEGCRLGNKEACDSLMLIKKGIVKVYTVEM